MSLLKVELQRHRFFGADGLFHTVRACPITKLVDLHDWLALLQDAIANAERSQSFTQQYLNDERIQQLCHECLRAAGVEPEWVDINQMSTLLFGREVDGQLEPGIIAKLNNLDKPADGDVVSLEEYEASVCSVLVGTGLAHDMASARELMRTIPMDEMQAAIEYRVESLKSLEQKKKEKQDAEAIRQRDELTAEMKERGVAAVLADFMGPMAGKRKITDPKPALVK